MRQFRHSQHDRTLGRAHNNLGYLYRLNGHYLLAQHEYERAAKIFKRAGLQEERADTLNNLAYVNGLLGDADNAVDFINLALSIRQDIGKRYPLARSHNTRGIIYALQDHPDWGYEECLKALKICEEIKEQRGIGLALNGLGLVLRKRGDQWKDQRYSKEQAETYFHDAETHLKRAIEVLESLADDEPTRFWEANNELGSLFCDWAWLTRHWQREEGDQHKRTAIKQYQSAESFQRKALEVARQYNSRPQYDLRLQIVDTYDDLAQVLGDQCFVYAEIGEVEQYRKKRQESVDYLDSIIDEVKNVDSHFILSSGKGFTDAPSEGEAYWQSLGKAYLWKSIWQFRDLEMDLIDQQQRVDTKDQAIEDLCLAVAYFQRYREHSFALERTLRYFRKFLRDQKTTTQEASQAIQQVETSYKIDLQVLNRKVVERLDF